MAEASKRMKGTGRVAFIAQRDTIVTDLEAGWPVKAVHARLADKLGISYPQFARYVRQLWDQGMVKQPLGSPSRARSARLATPSPVPRPTSPKPHPAPSPAPDDQHRPRTFTYDGNPKPDDKSRLIGPGRAGKQDASARPSFKHHGITQDGEAERLLPRGFHHDPVERPDDRRRLLGEE